MKIKIIMDSGKEYETGYFNSIDDLINSCYETNKVTNPFGKSNTIAKFSEGFAKISRNLAIRTDHISSIEGI